MIRRLYIRWKHFRKQHVIATDCWCQPIVKSYRS